MVTTIRARRKKGDPAAAKKVAGAPNVKSWVAAMLEAEPTLKAKDLKPEAEKLFPDEGLGNISNLQFHARYVLPVKGNQTKAGRK